MVTKFNTGDLVYAPVKIDKAEIHDGKIWYTVLYPSDRVAIPRILEEELIKSEVITQKAYVNIELKKEELNSLREEVDELNAVLERAKSIISDLAHREINVDVLLGKITSETQHASCDHREGTEIHLNEASKLFHTLDK